jgi:uncharacterized membrane protein required for colicin V production
MIIIDIIAAIILFFSLIGGLIQGGIRSFFSLLCYVIAIPIAGRFYLYFADWLMFLPGRNWNYILGFFIVLALATIALSFIFYLPRKITEESWGNGALFRLVGGFLNLLGAAIGLVVFTLLLTAYPVWDWLQQALASSIIIQWLVDILAFVQTLLPEIFMIQVPRVF